MRSLRLLIAAAFTLILSGGLVLSSTSGAQAADAYRYWAYYSVTDGAFVAQQTGPSGTTPTDGSIEGYRFAAPADFKNPNVPRADLKSLTFDSICGSKEAAEGKKRVAVLIDYGVEADANGATIPSPEALCAVAPTKANGLQVLGAVAPDLRTQKSSFGPLLCGISGYPATGCADEMAKKGTPTNEPTVEFATADSDTSGSDTSTAADDTDEDSNTGILVGVGGLIVILIAGGLYLSRRNRSAA